MTFQVGDRVTLLPCPPRRPESANATVIKAYTYYDRRWKQTPEVYDIRFDNGEISRGWNPHALEAKK